MEKREEIVKSRKAYPAPGKGRKGHSVPVRRQIKRNEDVIIEKETMLWGNCFLGADKDARHGLLA